VVINSVLLGHSVPGWATTSPTKPGLTFKRSSRSLPHTTNLGIQENCFPISSFRQLLQDIMLHRTEQTSTIGNPAVMLANYWHRCIRHDHQVPYQGLGLQSTCTSMHCIKHFGDHNSSDSAGANSNHWQIQGRLKPKVLLHWSENKMILFWPHLAIQS